MSGTFGQLIGTTSNSLFVDVDASGTQNGSSLQPYATIQQAIDDVPKATTDAEDRVIATIFIQPGTYDEHLTVDIEARRIRLVARGPVNLGVFDAATWQPSGTRRNVTISGDGDNRDVTNNVRSHFSMTSQVDTANPSGTVSSSFSSFRISGQILVTATTTGGAGNIDLGFECEIYGTDGTSSGTSFDATTNDPNMTVRMFRMRCRGIVNTGTEARLSHANGVTWDGALVTESFTEYVDCTIAAMSLDDQMSNSSTGRSGLRGCTVSGTFASTESNPLLVVDSATLNSIKANAITLPTDVDLRVKDVDPTVIFSGGGSPTTTQEYEYSAPSSGTAASHGTSTRTTLGEPRYLFQFVWDTASASTDTIFEIRVNNTVRKTITVGAAAGSALLVGETTAGLYLTSADDVISVAYLSGTAPGVGTVKVLGY